MSEEEKSGKPPLRSVPAKQSRQGKLVTRILYDEMYETYLHGNRNPNELVRKHNVSQKTARKAIDRGWAQQGWPPFKERAQFHDRQRQDAQQKEDPRRAKDARDFLEMRKELLHISHGIRSALANGLQQLLPMIPTAAKTITRPIRQVHYEEVMDEKGRVSRRVPRTLTVDVVTQPLIFDVLQSVHQVAAALDRTGGLELEQLMAKPPEGAKRAHRLTLAQLEYMAANGGRLPEGVSLEDLGEG